MIYHCVYMSQTNGIEVEAPGAETSSKIPDLATIEKWIGRDVSIAITLLSAIQSDKELRQQMAVFLQGRMINAENRPDPNQIKLGL